LITDQVAGTAQRHNHTGGDIHPGAAFGEIPIVRGNHPTVFAGTMADIELLGERVAELDYAHHHNEQQR
jgi:hypothetical protein